MPPPQPTTLDHAIAHHRAGRLDDAAAAYRRVLAQQPDHSAALHGLGVIEFSRGRHADALQFLQQAVAANPTGPGAAGCYGNLGPVLAELGRTDEALAAYRRSIELRPIAPEVHNNLAKLHYALGQPEHAIAEFHLALQQQPANADIANNLGLVLRGLGRTDDAIALFRRAIAARPDFGQAYNNLSIALHSQGQIADAIAASRQAVRLLPEAAECFNTLGNALQAQGQLADAVTAYQRAIALRPNLVEAHNNLGNALRQQRRLGEAIAAYRAALAIAPSAAKVHNNLGNTLQAAGDLDAAAAALQRSLELSATANLARSNLGNVLKDRGELSVALQLFQESMRERPDDPVPHSNYLYTLWYQPGETAASLAAAHQQWNRRHAQPLRAAWAPHPNDRSPTRRLRVGYVSPNFRDHCQALFLWPLLSNHDRAAVEIVCYSDVASPDAVTAMLQTKADVWRHTVGLTDAQLARLIRDDQIDVLVDLTLHMAHGRLLTFARRPAPVQLTWLGYPGTTGVDAIQCRLTDPHLEPVDSHNPSPFVEQPHHLPHTFWCYDPLTTQPPLGPLPALTNGLVTFGCLNNFCKVNGDVLMAWAAVLQKVPRSRMLMMVPPGQARQRVLDTLTTAGVAPDRIDFLSFQPRAVYLAAYQRIDLGLDTFPYNGHTTTLDSLWMGVPVVTRVGPTVVGRAGLSMLRNLDLPDLAAQSTDSYVQLATAWASNLEKLATLRAQLRDRMTASPLMNAPAFAAAMENAYRRTWQAHCNSTGEPAT
jgi:protein O-GlcNAc transferase